MVLEEDEVVALVGGAENGGRVEAVIGVAGVGGLYGVTLVEMKEGGLGLHCMEIERGVECVRWWSFSVAGDEGGVEDVSDWLCLALAQFGSVVYCESLASAAFSPSVVSLRPRVQCAP